MNRYEDIIHLPHPVSQKRERMTNADRAAQFSSFDALTGYNEAIAEAGRLTDSHNDLTDSALEELDSVLRAICARLSEQPRIRITYFLPDERKSGGARHTVTGSVQKLDIYRQFLQLDGGRQVPLEWILDVQLLGKTEKL